MLKLRIKDDNHFGFWSISECSEGVAIMPATDISKKPVPPPQRVSLKDTEGFIILRAIGVSLAALEYVQTFRTNQIEVKRALLQGPDCWASIGERSGIEFYSPGSSILVKYGKEIRAFMCTHIELDFDGVADSFNWKMTVLRCPQTSVGIYNAAKNLTTKQKND